MITDKVLLAQLSVFPCFTNRTRAQVIKDISEDSAQDPGAEDYDYRQLQQTVALCETDPQMESQVLAEVRKHYFQGKPWANVVDDLKRPNYRFGSMLSDLRKAGAAWLEKESSLKNRWMELETAKVGLHSTINENPRCENAVSDPGSRVITITAKQELMRKDLETAGLYAGEYRSAVSALANSLPLEDCINMHWKEREQIYRKVIREL